MKISLKKLKEVIREDVKKLINETGEWTGDEEDQAWMDAFKKDLDVIEKQLGDKFTVYDVRGFDKYQGPYANVKIGDSSYQVWTIENDPAGDRNFILWIDDYPVDNTSMQNLKPGFQGTVDEIIMLISKEEVVKETAEEEEKSIVGLENVIVYDNGGESFDRYTVFIGDDVYGMSHNPTSPQGFNQWIGDTSEIKQEKHLGEKLDSIPSEIQDAVLTRMDTEEKVLHENYNFKNNIAMKMTITELKKFIKEEAERLHKITLLETEKKRIDEKLTVLKEVKKWQKDVKPKKGKMHDLLNVPEGKKISSKYTSGEALAKALLRKVDRKKAAGMINYAANANPEDDIFDKAQRWLSRNSEKKKAAE